MTKVLRPIRSVVYLTTIFYAFLNAGWPVESSFSVEVGAEGFGGVQAATAVGIIQLAAALLGIAFDWFWHRKYSHLVHWVFAVLTLTYLYEFALIAIYDGNPFRWAPFLVYTVICAVLFLSEE